MSGRQNERPSAQRRFRPALRERAQRPSALIAVLLRHWRAVSLTVLAFSLVGLVFSTLVAPGYEATAEVIVQDPRAASTFDVTEGRPSTQDSERYLADQVRTLESSAVVGDVADVLGRDPQDVSESLEIVGDLTSNLIEIRYTASTGAEAAQGANGVVDAYVRVVAAQVRTNASLALAKIDALQASIDDSLARIDAQIDSRTQQNDSLRQVEEQISSAATELTRLRQERDALAVGSPARAALEARVREVAADLEALRLILELEVADPELDALIAERGENVIVRSQLDTRRNTIEVDLELASANLALVSAARVPDEPSGLPAWVVLAGFIGLGAVAAAAAAYFLELRDSTDDGQDPERHTLAAEPDDRGRGDDPMEWSSSPAPDDRHADPDLQAPERSPSPWRRDGNDPPEIGSSDARMNSVAPQPHVSENRTAPARDSRTLPHRLDAEEGRPEGGVVGADGFPGEPPGPDLAVESGSSGLGAAPVEIGEPSDQGGTDDHQEGPRPEDDLTVVFGIGPRVAALLNEHGVVRLAQLAEVPVDTLKEILRSGGSRFTSCNPESWPIQASLAANGRWLALKALNLGAEVTTINAKDGRIS